MKDIDMSNRNIHKTKIGRIIAIIAVLILGIGFVISIVAPHNGGGTTHPASKQATAQHTEKTVPPVLHKANDACNPHTTFNADNTNQESLVEDKDTQSLTLLSGAKSDFKTFDCLAHKLDIPTDVSNEILAKTDQPEQKVFTWNGLEGTWTYNVNSGLNLYITRQ